LAGHPAGHAVQRPAEAGIGRETDLHAAALPAQPRVGTRVDDAAHRGRIANMGADIQELCVVHHRSLDKVMFAEGFLAPAGESSRVVRIQAVAVDLRLADGRDTVDRLELLAVIGSKPFAGDAPLAVEDRVRQLADKALRGEADAAGRLPGLTDLQGFAGSDAL